MAKYIFKLSLRVCLGVFFIVLFFLALAKGFPQVWTSPFYFLGLLILSFAVVLIILLVPFGKGVGPPLLKNFFLNQPTSTPKFFPKNDLTTWSGVILIIIVVVLILKETIFS